MKELDLHTCAGVVATADKWYEQMGLDQSTERKLGMLLGEVEEVVEAIEQGDKEHMKCELGDLIFCTFNLMNDLGIDANEAMEYVFNKNMSRVNPDHVSNIRSQYGVENGTDLYKLAKRDSDLKNGY